MGKAKAKRQASIAPLEMGASRPGKFLGNEKIYNQKALTIGSNHDEMATLMPNATAAICPNGSHMALWDDQAIYFRHLLAFMGSV
jgi:hypothetical protein